MPSAEPDDARERLAARVRQRRRELRLSQAAAAAEAGMDRNTWMAMEAATRAVADWKYADIERVLQWPVGTVESIVSGEEKKPEGKESEATTGPGERIREIVANAGWDEGTNRAILAIVETEEARLAELRKSNAGPPKDRSSI